MGEGKGTSLRGGAASPQRSVASKTAALRRAIAATRNLVEKAKLLKRIARAQRKAASLATKAKDYIRKKNEVTADEMCHMFRDVLETRTVIPRGARAPNGSGPKRRYYRESCANPNSTALKRLRCQKRCCSSYEQHIKPRGVRPGDRAHCEGIDCKIKRRSPGTRGKQLSEAVARRKSSSSPKNVNGAGKRRQRSSARDGPAGSPASAGREGKRASRGSPAPKRPRTAAAATKRARTAAAATPKRARTAARTAAKSPPRTRKAPSASAAAAAKAQAKAQSKAQSKAKAKL